MVETINKHKNDITAISFILIVAGFAAGVMGNGELKASPSLLQQSSLEYRLLLKPCSPYE